MSTSPIFPDGQVSGVSSTLQMVSWVSGVSSTLQMVGWCLAEHFTEDSSLVFTGGWLGVFDRTGTACPARDDVALSSCSFSPPSS